MFTTITVRASPARVAQRLPQLSRTFTFTSKKASSPLRISTRTTAKSTGPISSRLHSSTLLAARNMGARSYMQQSAPPQQSPWRRILVAGGIFGGTLLAVNVVFNRETRTDGGMPVFEREYLNDTFLHTGLGVGIIGLTARQLVSSGAVFRIMSMNPWVFGLGGLALSFGSMIATRSINPDNYIPKYAAWAAFNATQAAMIAPLLAFYPPAIIARAGLYAAAMMGGISVVGATAKQDKYLYIGGPLMAGACVILASGLAPLVIPATAVRTLALTESIWLYGGLAVFGGFTLYDVQKVLHHARLAEQGLIQRDAVNESISLELDFLNIFIRLVQILGMNGNRRK